MEESVIVSVSGLSAQSGLRVVTKHRVHIIDTLVLRMSPRTDTKARMRNEKWDEKRDRKHGVSAALFNSRTDGKSLARTIATINEFHLLRFARSFNCSLCLYAIAHPHLSRDNKSFVVHLPLCCTI